MTLIAGPQSGYLSIRVIIYMSSLLHRQLPQPAGEVLRGLHPGSQQLGTGLITFIDNCLLILSLQCPGVHLHL